MSNKMTAIGIANPIYRRKQSETAELIISGLQLTPAEKRLLRSVYRATGIDYRHSVLPDYCKSAGEFEFFPNNPEDVFPSTKDRMEMYQKNALNLATKAIQDCFLSIEQFDKNRITHLITVSCTGMYAPGIDIELVQQFDLNPNTQRTCINFMGCYGAFNAIKVADAICKADSNATVLIVCVEICTIHFQKKMVLDNLISNSIFADGAAAVLIQSESNAGISFNLDDFYCTLLPQSSKEMAWHIADYGFDIVLSSYVPQVIGSGIPKFVDKLLQQRLLSAVDFYAIHPGGLKILQACESALNISVEDNRYSYEVLKNFGNMSSATVLFVLKHILRELTQNDLGKTIFSCAFGPGLTLESMLLSVA